MFGTEGQLDICAPGMGELRQSYRHFAPVLARHGYRVVTVDIRGHGDSDAAFSAYDDVALATDLLALIDEWGAPAVIVGNSMGAGAAVIAAADEPGKVHGLALIGPFVRNPPGGRAQARMLRLLLTKPWGPRAFMWYYPKWMPGIRPADFAAHTALVRENLQRPGHWAAFVQTTRTTHEPAER
ncbi:alpha/beta hydrolase [Cryobacterium psychrophilum]|uniref:alpha/beta hydrolase n=1 Tax=Cryobacterium psychrophilum TaxID=41988 RepID=UPI0018E0708B|nr:alpha/beta fold hydrolase [Cryobacterium psychrophilum]